MLLDANLNSLFSMEQIQIHFWFDVLTPGAMFLVSNVVRADYNTAINK